MDKSNLCYFYYIAFFLDKTYSRISQ